MGCNCGGSKQWTPPAEEGTQAAATQIRGAASPGYFAPKQRPVWNGPQPKQDT